MTFTTPPNLQRGAAAGLRQDDDYFASLAGDLQRKRDRLGGALADIGFDGAAGARHLLRHHRFPAARASTASDEDFCRHITVEAGVTAVPVCAVL